MNRSWKVRAAAATAAALIASHGASAAVDAPGIDALAGDQPTPVLAHRLDVEMTVRNWVLCASRPLAERLVRARQQSRAAAEKAYADLESARSCGRLAKMQVILQEPLYDALIGADGGHAGVYGALINISGKWASGFVVYGGVPED